MDTEGRDSLLLLSLVCVIDPSLHPLFSSLIPRFPDVHWTLAVPLASLSAKSSLSLSLLLSLLFLL